VTDINNNNDRKMDNNNTLFPAAKFSMFQNANISNVTINIYGNETVNGQNVQNRYTSNLKVAQVFSHIVLSTVYCS